MLRIPAGCAYIQKNNSPYGIIKCSHCPIKWPMGQCSTDKTSYLSSPISEILALPAKNESFAKKAANIHDLSRDVVVGEVAKASGLPVECDIWSHIKAIENKARDEGYDIAKEYLAECSGVDQNELIFDHIRAIKEKAVEEYFEKQPAAKLVSCDVDNAFKQYENEQKAPIFRELAAESGLDPTSTVKAHMNAIYSNGFDDGRDAEREHILNKIGEMLKG